MSSNGENELFKMQKVIELKHQVSATFQFLSELWSNNSGEMSEFDSGLYFQVAFFAFLIRLGSGEFSIIYNLCIRVKISTNSQIVFRSDSIDMKLLNSISLPSIDKLSGPTEKSHVNSNIFFKAETSDKLFYFERMSLENYSCDFQTYLA